MLVSLVEVGERNSKENQHVRHFSSPRTLRTDEPEFFKGKDPRGDPRVRDALKALGKLRE
jgi:hypothetical protein